MSIYNDYASFTATTAIYPEQVAAEYLTLGLCSEVAECLELIDTGRQRNRTYLGNEIGGEAGDCVWYVARLAVTYGFDFDGIVNKAKAGYKPSSFDIETLLQRMAVMSGLIAGKVKKALRDGHKWTGEEREEVRQYIRQCLTSIVQLLMHLSDWMYANHCSEYGSFDKIMQQNRKKLQSRLERNVLSGSGNHR